MFLDDAQFFQRESARLFRSDVPFLDRTHTRVETSREQRLTRTSSFANGLYLRQREFLGLDERSLIEVAHRRFTDRSDFVQCASRRVHRLAHVALLLSARRHD